MAAVGVMRRTARRAVRGHGRTFASTGVPAYQFASKGYAMQFLDQPVPDGAVLRAETIKYLRSFDEQAWYNDPVRTILKGTDCGKGLKAKTVDAFGGENGEIIVSTPEQVEMVLNHIETYKPPKTDYRAEMRRVERAILSPSLAGRLIGNQARDFMKQDGITEIEESIQANSVERRLNDALFADEAAGRIHISRRPAFVGCVSNFSNFLDLCRKVMRNMELGVPVVVLSRNNTTQHMFRWSQMLLELMEKEGVDLGMLTYFACDRAAKTKAFRANPNSPAYFTCSREVAFDVKKTLPKIMSSTGGPNTMISTTLTPEVSAALQMSAMIENSGQCTAMRHFVIPGFTEADMDATFHSTPVVQSALQSIEDGMFAGIFHDKNDRPLQDDYKSLPSQPLIHFRIGSEPPEHIEEGWREPIIDATAPSHEAFESVDFKRRLINWLNREQPISCAVNGNEDLAMEIWERTGLVVFTIGSLEKPALTAQARPQDGECFGEFPPRMHLNSHTHLPVIIPSATPGYNSWYTDAHLRAAAEEAFPTAVAYCNDLFEGCSAPTLGFTKLLAKYLVDACGPKRGVGTGRTSLYGLQRPPLLSDAPTVLRVSAGAKLDAVAPVLLPFYITNARSNLEVSIDANNPLAEQLARFDVKIVVESDAGFTARIESITPNNVLEVVAETELEPLPAMHWVSRFFPLGHVKSVFPGDEAFCEKFSKSPKWLAVARSG